MRKCIYYTLCWCVTMHILGDAHEGKRKLVKPTNKILSVEVYKLVYIDIHNVAKTMFSGAQAMSTVTQVHSLQQ